MKVFKLCCSVVSSAFVLRKVALHRPFVTISKPLLLNRILISESEVTTTNGGSSMCSLPPDDTRSSHIRKILKLNPGDNLRVGVINRGMVDKATLISDSQDAEKETIIDIGPMNDLVTKPRPIVDMILASPRPPRLVYLMPVIACLGVCNLHLIGASKVEKMYFSKFYDTH